MFRIRITDMYINISTLFGGAASQSELLPPWFPFFNKELVHTVSFSDHEAFDHPVACKLLHFSFLFFFLCLVCISIFEVWYLSLLLMMFGIFIFCFFVNDFFIGQLTCRSCGCFFKG